MKKIFSVVFALAVLLTCATSSANEQLVIEASGNYIMDSRLDETPASATARAREEAKRTAVEKAGVYLESYSKTINFELDTDEVRTVAARILKIQNETSNVEVLERNLLKFTVTITAVVDDNQDEILKTMMQDKQSLEELTRKNNELQEKYDALNREMSRYKNDFDQASEAQRVEIKQAVARNSERFSAVDEVARGNSFAYTKNYAQALAAYDAAIKFDPKLAEAYNNRGIVRFELKQFAAAIDDYTTAISLKSNYADALNNRGNAFATLEQFSNAEQDLRTAAQLKDNSAVIHNNLGSVYLSQKKFNAAISEYARAIQLNPSYAEAYYNRAIAHYAQKNFAQALTDVQQAMALNPNDAATRALYERINRSK